VPNSCAVVSDARATKAVQAGWSTPDPVRGLDPGGSAVFTLTPESAATYRISSLVPGAEASGMWATLRIVGRGSPSIEATG
jgi:uncharacterized cupredoxin-like copper-binding protein